MAENLISTLYRYFLSKVKEYNAAFVNLTLKVEDSESICSNAITISLDSS
jgi:hypothetical protein